LIRAPLILVIDALDECDEENGIQNIVQLLKNAQVLRKVWFRILITSRPAIPIRYGFSQLSDGEHRDFVLHNISQDFVDHDIFVFLKHNLETVAQKCAFGPDWPGDMQLLLAVTKQRTRMICSYQNILSRVIAVHMNTLFFLLVLRTLIWIQRSSPQNTGKQEEGHGLRESERVYGK
jgi:hypothetical protein